MNSVSGDRDLSGPAARSSLSAFFSGSAVVALAVIALGVLDGGLKLWNRGGWELLSSPAECLIAGGLLFGASLAGLRWTGNTFDWKPHDFSYGLAVFFFSAWLTNPYNLFQAPAIRGEILLGTSLFLLLLPKIRRFPVGLSLVLTALFCWHSFNSAGAGKLLFSDDHPAFLYRLMLLKEHFPNIPLYLPLWNAGEDVRAFFANGSLNVFLVLWPLIQGVDLVSWYNPLVCTLLFVLFPAVIYLSGRLAELSRDTSAIAALLALSNSLLWYRWSLKYGTLGFITSTILLPLVLVLAARILDPNYALRKREAASFIAIFSLMLLWSPSGIALLPLIIAGAFLLPKLFRKRYVLITVALALAINLPWIAIFLSVSKVSSFISSESAANVTVEHTEKAETSRTTPAFRHDAGGADLNKSLKLLREYAVSSNPLIFLFGLPGLALLRRRYSLSFGAVALWLGVLGTILVPFKPQLELDRMLVTLGILLSLPAAALCSSILSVLYDRQTSVWRRLAPALVAGFLVAGPLATAHLILNRNAVEQYAFADSTVPEMVQAIKKLDGDGRVLYSGFVLHELSNGHLAPLALWTGKPLIASSHIHNLWKYRQVFPRDYLADGDRGIQSFLDLMNVSAVFAHEREWRTYFSERPTHFEKVWQGGRFSLYQRKNFQSNYFLSGSGKILAQQTDGIRLMLDTDEAVIKFRYFPFLESSGCRLSPYTASPSVVLIHISGCSAGQEIFIRSAAGWKRVNF